MCPKSNETGVTKTLLKNTPKSNSLKVIAFHFKTLVHSPFSGFNTLLEGIFWDLFELGRRDYFDGIDERKMGSIQNRFDFGEKEKVTGGQIEEIWGVFQSRSVPFGEKLTNTQGCVSRSVIVVERPRVSVMDPQGQ